MDQHWLPSKQPTAKVPRLTQAFAKFCLVWGLTAIEKQSNVAGLTEGPLTKILPTDIKRDTKPLATFMKNPNIKLKKDKGTRRNLSARDLGNICRASCTQQNTTSASIFASAGVTPRSRQARCKVLNEMAQNVKHIQRPPTEPNSQRKTIGLGTEIHEYEFATCASYR